MLNMRKEIYSVIIVAAICFLTGISCIIGAGIVSNKQIAIEESQEKLNYMAESYSNYFRAAFDSAEQIVYGLNIVAEEAIDVSQCNADSELFEERLEYIAAVIKRQVSGSNYPIGLYLTFSPEISGDMDEVWYAKDSNGKVRRVESNLANDKWLKETSNNLKYLEDTIKAGELWTEMDPVSTFQWDVVSKTKAVYDKDGELIGVIGLDIRIDDINTILDDINSQTKGKAALYNGNGNLIAGDEVTEDMLKSDYYLHAQADIGEMWSLVILQTAAVSMSTISQISKILVVTGLVVILLVIIVMYFFYTNKGKLIIRELEEKDMLIVNSSRRAQMGNMIAFVAHQWKRPLAGMNLSLSNMSSEYSGEVSNPDEFNGRIDRLHGVIHNLSDTLDDFSSFMAPEKEESVFSVNEEIAKYISVMWDGSTRRGYSIDVTGSEVFVYGHKNELLQSLFNLIENACDAIKASNQEDKTVRINVSREKGMCCIRVSNKGNPISDEIGEKIFDLYYTTKDDSGKSNDNSGVGLYLSRQIVRHNFNGDLYYNNLPDGVEFVIEIPAAREENR